MTGDRTEPLRPRDPRQLGEYELVGRLGEGGMGTVYLAKTPAGVLVAVKVIRVDLAHDDEFRRRFRSEVARARQVPPFCTAEVLDADPDHEQPYLVVEYVDGPTLADVVEQRGPLTAANLHSVAIGVATALTAIHGAGVIHRDLKPRNVLLAPGTPKVIDFGIARAMEATSGGNTSPDQMVGTVAYMAPERFGLEADTPLTPAADVFAWGTVVAYAGTGRTPFAADSPPATAARILTQPPDLTGLSGPLRDLVARALAKEPADRPSARELLDLLVDGPQRPAATAAALADQPDLRAAAAEAQAVTGFVAAPAGMVGYDEESIITVPISAMDIPAMTADLSPEPRRRWFLPVAVAALILAVVAGAGMLLMNTSSSGVGPPAIAAPAPSPPAVVVSAVPVTAPLIADDLRQERYWTAQSYVKAQCYFEDALIAHRENSDSVKCQSPDDPVPADFRAEVTARLITKGSCAAIWLRHDVRLRAYLVRVCENRIYFGTHKPKGGTQTLRTIALDKPIELGTATRIGLTAVGTSLELARDGVTVGTAALTDPEIKEGRVLLGEYADPNADRKKTYEVAFTDVSIWAYTP
ncbi:serine/threonine protein kinase [Micromonosporaceae bacterium Da 78-11]